ncbi:unnamed protein product [Paramecium primaurelia]|uniref:Ubiquitin-like domain-containing protein n=1 Tax=Paramecium primaurelia TaxID=5886 RepID=A0A8S1QKT9_PARPR|nr:unnamed protein product [Paramecium primaurelia]
MINRLKIIIKPQNQNLDLEVEQSILVEELFQYIQTSFKIDNDLKNWKCYSESKGMYLDVKSQLGNVDNDKLIINTQHFSNTHTRRHQDQQSINNQHFQTPQQQINNQYQQKNKKQDQIYSHVFNEIPNPNNKSNQVSINFEIICGNFKRQFSRYFNIHDDLNKLKRKVMKYLGYSSDAVYCQLIIFQRVMSPQHFEKSLDMLSIKNNTTVQVRLGWL